MITVVDINLSQVLSYLPGVVAIACLGYLIKEMATRRQKQYYARGTIVKISKRYRKKYNISTKYGISDGITVDRLTKTTTCEVILFLSPQEIARRNKDITAQILSKEKELRKISSETATTKSAQQASLQNAYAQTRYYSQFESQFELGYSDYSQQDLLRNTIARLKVSLDNADLYGETRAIPLKALKVMPDKFDVTTETVKKELGEPTKGGEKKMRKMPRIFRFAIYLAIVWLIWDVVFNANYIVNLLFHSFILRK